MLCMSAFSLTNRKKRFNHKNEFPFAYDQLYICSLEIVSEIFQIPKSTLMSPVFEGRHCMFTQ